MVAHCIQLDGAVPFSFVTCLSSREVFDANFLASPTMGSRAVHELIAVANCPSAADGLNVGLKRAKHEWVVWVHEDVLLPEGWDRCLANQHQYAEQRFGQIGVAGVYGVGEDNAPANAGVSVS
jgi:Glycosyltransferase like family